MNTVPLQIGQQGLWFLGEVDERAGVALNMTFAFEAQAAIDESALRTALRHLAVRHEVLRCAVGTEAGIPSLRVAAPDLDADVPLRVVEGGDLRGIAAAEIAASIDLSRCPLYRVVLSRPPPGTPAPHGIVFTFPHMVFDERSASIFMRELSQAYAASLRSELPNPGPAPASLAELVQQATEFLASPTAKNQIAEMVDALRGVPDRLAISDATSDPHTQTGVAGLHAFSLPPQLCVQVAAFCRAQRLSHAAFYLAAFQVLLWHYSSQPDFGVAIPVSNRSVPGAANALGYLMNVAIARSNIDPCDSVEGFAGKVMDCLLNVLECSGIPFPTVVKALRRAGQDAKRLVSQVGFNYLAASSQAVLLGSIPLRPIDTIPKFAKGELALDVQESAVQTSCRIVFDADMLSSGQIESMSRQYVDAIAGMLDNPSRPLSSLPRVGSVERARLLALSRGEPAHADAGDILEAIARRAAIAPDAVAVMSREQTLTYAELRERSNVVAGALSALLTGPEPVVATCLAKGADSVVAMLAILKAGAVYLPLDPGHPVERSQFQLGKAGAQVLLTQEWLRDRFSEFLGATTSIETLRQSEAPAHPLSSEANAFGEQVAYCIFTSGTSGRPKGVLVSRASLNGHVRDCIARYRLTPEDRVLQFASDAFDAAIEQSLSALCAGACLVMRDGEMPAPDELADAIRSAQITVADIPTAYWHRFAQSRFAALASTRLRLVIIGGEGARAASAGSVALAFETINAYGPTETTITATTHLLSAEGKRTPFVPLGRPLGDTRVYVVDAQLGLLPHGAVGELCIAGLRVGRGYLAAPALTAAAFVPDPFGAPGTRMYRTGDRGRWLPDGTLEFLGRADDQVKIRGVRVEALEVEQRLVEQADVSAAVVVPMRRESDDVQLVAYVVPAAGSPRDESRLRLALGTRLPAAAIPAIWMFMDSLPLNQSGKLDRSALPEPVRAAPGRDRSLDGPKTTTERLVAEVWCDVLNLSSVSTDDNFFMLGGHSLIAAQVVGTLRQRMNRNINTRVLFDYPTIAAFAAALDMSIAAETTSA